MEDCRIKDIIVRVKLGDKEAFSELYRIYFPRIYSFIFRILADAFLAEDLTQEVFFRLWINHKQVEPEMQFDSFFFTIAKNLTINTLNKNRLKTINCEEIADSKDDNKYSNPETVLNYLELQQIVNEAINSMPTQQQLVFRLSREQGLLNDSIAQKLGISKRTVEKHISNSLKNLREIIKKNYILFFLT